MMRVAAVIALLMAVMASAQSAPVAFCRNSSVLVMQDNFTVCGQSPVLNPSGLQCQQYNRSIEKICAAGCMNSQCTPLAFDRSILIAGVIILVFAAILAIWRYGR